MPYRNGVWRPARDASKASTGDKMETSMRIGTVEGSTQDDKLCVRFKGLMASVPKDQIRDVLLPGEQA